jgi:hypothetical protein
MRDIGLLGEVKRMLDFGASGPFGISPKEGMASRNLSQVAVLEIT